MKKQGENKVWHALNMKKSKYFLVDLVSHGRETGKATISYEGEQVQVLANEIFQYDPDKPRKLSELRFINPPEIMDWMNKNGGENEWVRVSPRVVLDFCIGTEKKRKQHLTFLFSRFLVGVKPLQYVCVANDPIARSQEYTVHNEIIEILEKTTNLWPYAIPLSSLRNIYNSFFLGTAIKFKIFIKESKIIKLDLHPFALTSKQFFGSEATGGGLLELKPNIFVILNASGHQQKQHFKIPQNIKEKSQQFSVRKLVDCLLGFGLKVPEINNMIEVFSIIMNLNELQMIKSKIKQDHIFKIRRTQAKDNLFELLSPELFNLLETELNNFEKEQDSSIDNISVKQEVLMWLIWKEALNYVAEVINGKLVNLQAQFTQDVRKFIFIEFPALGQTFQQSVQNLSLQKINNLIKRVALNMNIKPKGKAFQLQKEETIMNKIKQQNTYDINSKILRDLQKDVKEQKILKNCAFMREFRKIKFRGSSNKHKETEQEINSIIEELTRLKEESDSRFVNFIIRSESNSNQQPSQNLLEELKQSIEQDRRQRKDKKDKMLEEQIAEQQLSPQEWIEMKPSTFEDRYTYCSMFKKFSKNGWSVFDGCERHFKQFPNLGKVKKINDQYYIYLSEEYFEELETQKKKVEFYARKIQRQYRHNQYRKIFSIGLRKQFVRIRFYAWLCNRTYPSMKHAFKQVRKSVAINKAENALISYCINSQRKPFKKLKRRSSAAKLGRLENKVEPRSIRRARSYFWARLIQIRNKRRQTEACNRLNKQYLSCIFDRQKQFMMRMEMISNCKKKQSATTQITSIASRVGHKRKRQSMSHINAYTLSKREFELRQLQRAELEKKQQDRLQKQRQEKEKEKERKQRDRKQKQRQQRQGAEKQQRSRQNRPQSPLPPILIPDQPSSEASEPHINIYSPFVVSHSSVRPEPVSQQNAEASEKQRKYSAQNTDKSQVPKKKQNDNRSNGASSVRGNEMSEDILDITKDELYVLRDCPKFSFESWLKNAVGYEKRKPVEVEKKAPITLLFNGISLERPANRQPEQQLDVDILIKEKIVVNPFFPYLVEHVGGGKDENLNKLMSHQYSVIKEPILKQYTLTKYKEAPMKIFNNILKLGRDKNSSKSKLELLNEIVKYIRESYFMEKEKVANVIDNEPALIVDYSWEHNIVKDEVFIQIIKQLMDNDLDQSLKELFLVLEVLTRYYYPSPQFMYSFLYYLKSLQSKNIPMANSIFTNVLLFAQAYEKYKGNNVTVLKNQLPPKQKQSCLRLESRVTSITEQELKDKLIIRLTLLNNEDFEYKVRNETISYFRRRVLKDINFLEYEQYFGVYLAQSLEGPMHIMNEGVKAVDFLISNPQNTGQNILFVKLKYYFPFNLKQVNKTKFFYLNSVYEEKNLPWTKEHFEYVVAMAMMFDDFQEQRIGQYLRIIGQTTNPDIDLKPIEDKFDEISKTKGQMINEVEYFKIVKEANFLGAKGYRMKDVSIFSSSKVSRIIIKPLELCLYEGTELMSSINLKRIKSHLLEKGQIYLEIDYNEKGDQGMRSITLRGVDRVSQLYQDIVAYLGYLSFK